MEQMIERRTYLAVLFDLYGGLLTEKQQLIFDWYYQCDLSLGEIAAEQNISRQAVYDILKRTEHGLEEYERKLHLAEKELQRQMHLHALVQYLTQQDIDDALSGLLRNLGWEG